MKTADGRNRAGSSRFGFALRAALSVLLVAMLGLETLPWGLMECATAAPTEERGNALCVEPLSVCDSEDSFLGMLFEFPVLNPGAPGLHPSTESLPVVHRATVFVSDGFRPTIERPPRRLA
jgi:hypothetical protein